jgi:hypothetical protein
VKTTLARGAKNDIRVFVSGEYLENDVSRLDFNQPGSPPMILKRSTASLETIHPTDRSELRAIDVSQKTEKYQEVNCFGRKRAGLV